MPTLDWIGKKAVLNHHNDVPFHLLRCNPELSVGDDSGNLLIQGDNLLALKALLPYYGGQVKCIYIDPPYNTGNESWVYNDNVNSPEMREWLGKVVGGEAEDLSRHDKWLCMMYPRLVLLREMLREDGSIWVSIDDNEVQNLRYILDEVFGPQNFIATVIWQKIDGPKNSAMYLSEDHDYIIIYAKNSRIWRPNKLPRTEDMISRYKNPDNDPRGPWLLSDLAARNYYAQGRYAIQTPSGRVIDGPPAGSYWRVSKEKFDELDRDGRIWWGKSGNNRPGIKRFLTDVQDGIVPQTLWFWKDVGSTRNSKQELSKIMDARASQELFITPKPTGLVERIFQIASQPGDLVMDSFAGSGTTGHAAIKQNRHFILIEMDPTITQNITSVRVSRIIQGYDWKSQKGDIRHEEGLGSGFRYCELGPTLFDRFGQIRPEVAFSDLARHIFFTETGQPLPGTNEKSPLLGVHNGLAIYLLYNGIMRDAGNELTLETFGQLPSYDGPKIVYGDGCRISSERQRQMNITFKQIPYEVKVR
ncbi:MAG TPA: site-specific DNA-methyltransferase [Anaerolineaceae bacterium]|nr:site-specific DNA-methyltransferase [Anaerolineaceae bacterium]HPN51225.1 site-specific DNA-methyltransferase [Anaerolineaceae bacterium]